MFVFKDKIHGVSFYEFVRLYIVCRFAPAKAQKSTTSVLVASSRPFPRARVSSITRLARASRAAVLHIC